MEQWPAPFSSKCNFFGENIFGNKKNFFLRGKKFVFLKKILKKKFWTKLGNISFFNLMVPYFDSNRIFSGKITILSYKTIFGPAFSIISENLVEQFFRKFQKTVILCKNGHFLARLAKIGQNENFYSRAIFYPYCPPTSCGNSEKSLERFPRSIRYIHPSIHSYIHTYKGDLIEPVAFAVSIIIIVIFFLL